MSSAAEVVAAATQRYQARSSAEDWLLSLSLLAMLLLPAAEVLLRGAWHVGLVNSAQLVQHLVLVVGMLGAVVATREQRLLAFDGLQNLLPENVRIWSRRFAEIVALAVTLWLAVASLQFVLAERQADLVLAYGVRIWAVQAVMPLGFAWIAVRMLLTTAAEVHTRALLSVLAVALCMPFLFGQNALASPFLGLVLLAALFGAPMFCVLGGVALALFAGADLPVAAVPLSHYQLASNPSLPAIPLFTLAGYFLAESGAPARLIKLFQALFGRFTSGAGIITILLTAFFTSFTGASGVTILALGGLLLPLLLSVGYSQTRAVGLITSAPALGTLLPPALPLLLYAIIARQPIETMFLAGIVPTVLLTGLLLALCLRMAPPAPVTKPWDWAEIRTAMHGAKWELCMPVVAFGLLLSGAVTPVETASLTALYALFVVTVIHKDLSMVRDLPRVTTECGLLVGGIILILGMALGFTNYLADAQVPDRLAEWARSAIGSRWLFLIMLNVFLLLVGMVMDIYSAIIVVTPLIAPMGADFGVDPIHLGIIFLANMELGFLTPPVGVNLFFASYRFSVPMEAVVRSVVPAVLALAAGVLLITYLPILSTGLPGLFR